MYKILWKKLQDNAIIPSKTKENIGYDIYHTNTEDFEIAPHETVMVPTGLAAAIVEEEFYSVEPKSSNRFALIAKDRGSTGSIGLHTHCGVIDAGYRGEIFIALSNTNNAPIVFTSKVKKTQKICVGDELLKILYPIDKAIAQLIVVESYDFISEEITNDETWIRLCNTERGEGKLGSSQK